MGIKRSGSTTLGRVSAFSDLPLLFSGNGLESIKNVNVDLVPGSIFEIELDLNLPVGPAFDLAGAELVFEPVTPPGLILLDVRGEGFSSAVIRYQVATPSAYGNGPDVFIAAGALGAYLVANWLILSLASMGIFITLGSLIDKIRGKGDGSVLSSVLGFLKNPLTIFGITAGVGALFLVNSSRRR